MVVDMVDNYDVITALVTDRKPHYRPVLVGPDSGSDRLNAVGTTFSSEALGTATVTALERRAADKVTVRMCQ